MQVHNSSAVRPRTTTGWRFKRWGKKVSVRLGRDALCMQRPYAPQQQHGEHPAINSDALAPGVNPPWARMAALCLLLRLMTGLDLAAIVPGQRQRIARLSTSGAQVVTDALTHVLHVIVKAGGSRSGSARCRRGAGGHCLRPGARSGRFGAQGWPDGWGRWQIMHRSELPYCLITVFFMCA